MTETVTREAVTLAHRVYVNGFPKSGLHLVEKWVQRIANPASERPWLGTFTDNAWSLEWAGHVPEMPGIFAQMPAGLYVKGHSGWLPELAEGLYNARIATLFLYRDLRDVAVSSAFHVLDRRKEDNGTWSLNHFDKDLFTGRSFEDVLIDMITGRGQHVGVVERWRVYQNWLNEKWVHHVRFEDMVNQPAETAALIVRYIFGITASWAGVKCTFDRAYLDALVATMLENAAGGSTTHRRGVTGEWTEHWTEAVQAAWNESGGPQANEELCYG